MRLALPGATTATLDGRVSSPLVLGEPVDLSVAACTSLAVLTSPTESTSLGAPIDAVDVVTGLSEAELASRANAAG